MFVSIRGFFFVFFDFLIRRSPFRPLARSFFIGPSNRRQLASLSR
jgi:hypothetical protein